MGKGPSIERDVAIASQRIGAGCRGPASGSQGPGRDDRGPGLGHGQGEGKPAVFNGIRQHL